MKISKSEGAFIADRDLFLTVDGRPVDGDDPGANSLVARAGHPIPVHLVEALGIKETKEAKHEDEPKKAKS